MTAPVDLLVRNAGYIVTMEGPELPGGWVAIRGGIIAAVGASEWNTRAIGAGDGGRAGWVDHARDDLHPSSYLSKPDPELVRGRTDRWALRLAGEVESGLGLSG